MSSIEYGTPEYWLAVSQGAISWDNVTHNHTKKEQRRQRSLKTCRRPANNKKTRAPKPTTKAYTPEVSAVLDEDTNLITNADKCARFLMRQAYKKARKCRTIRITNGYIGQFINRSVRQVERYLKNLEEEGYIQVKVIMSAVTGMVECLEIKLLAPLFPCHHKQKWPESRNNPDTTKLSDKQSKEDNFKAVSRNNWAIRCFRGVELAYRRQKAAQKQAVLL